MQTEQIGKQLNNGIAYKLSFLLGVLLLAYRYH
jgi:hypothetical protein